MSITPTQKEHILNAHAALKERGMVFLSGRQDGKTRVATRLQEMTPVANGRGSYTLRARHDEDNDIEFVSGIFYGRADKISPYSFMRQIMLSLGEKPGHGFWEATKRFEDLLMSYYTKRRVLCIAIDNAELLPERAYTILKMLNEMRKDRKDIGTASVIAGQFGKMRMPMEFLKRCTEIQVGPITASTEIAQLIETHWPGEASYFTESALNAIRSTSETTLELRRNIGITIRKRRILQLDEINGEVVSHALAA